MFVDSSVQFIEGGLNSDNGIVDAARVSFAKRADSFTEEQNRKLMKYLFEHKHWSPFGHARAAFRIHIEELAAFMLDANMAGFTFSMLGLGQVCLNGSIWAWYENVCYLPLREASGIRRALRELFPIAGPMLLQLPSSHGYCAHLPELHEDNEEYANVTYVSFRVKAPIFVARQLVKHQIGLCWNEVSRRYVDDPPEFYRFKEFHSRPDKSIKQGAGEISPFNKGALTAYSNICTDALNNYTRAISDLNLAPEEARAILPLAMMTEWIWTGHLEAFHRVCSERLAPNVQGATRDVAADIALELGNRFPKTWKALWERPFSELG